MPKRCPPGVLCIENVTIMFICVILLIVLGGVYICKQRTEQKKEQPPINNTIIMERKEAKGRGADVFYDLYKPPLRDDRCFNQGTYDVRGGVPINVSTQSCDDAPYRQIGILTRDGGKDETILPLMGRPLFLRRDKWNF